MILCVVACQIHAQENLLRSSVAEEFRGGLQEKYLTYIAEQAGMRLDIYPMPLARRVHALKEGEIDIMVGVKEGFDTEDKFVYLHPSYETLQSLYYIRAEDIESLTQKSDLYGLHVGITVNDKPRMEVFRKLGIEVFPINSLKRKIIMLQSKRIDAFRHFEESTQLMLEDMGLSEHIIAARYQEEGSRRYYVAISKRSPLFNDKQIFEKVIAEGLQKRDFARIRLQHYLDLDDDSH